MRISVLSLAIALSASMLAACTGDVDVEEPTPAPAPAPAQEEKSEKVPTVQKTLTPSTAPNRFPKNPGSGLLP